MKFSKDKDSVSMTSEATNERESPPLNEDTVKARTKSIDEQLKVIAEI